VRVRGHADAEVDVGLCVLGLAARADRPDGRALRDGLPLLHGDRAEMHERRGVPVRRLDRDRAAAAGNGSGEGDRAARRRDDALAGASADVDAAMLPARVRVGAEHEGL
jgi:hypothetical protein